MSQDIRQLVTPSTELLAFGEPTHLEPAFADLRNDLFARLAGHGFASIALETDRVAALVVNDFVQNGVGTHEKVMREGFSHTFGQLDTNRRLVAWMREYNENRPPEERLAFHGFDIPTETMSAPSPRTYLEHGRDYLGVDLDIAGLAGEDGRWSRTEAIMDPARSAGRTAEADRLRALADDLLIQLGARAPELIAATSRAGWFEARTHLTAGLALLRYHAQAAEDIDGTTRWNRLCAIRDAVMAQNLFDIRDIEADRGVTLVFAHNRHLQRNRSRMRMGPMDMEWYSAGAIVAAVAAHRYTFVAGSLGRSETIELREPRPETYEGLLQRRIGTWGLAAPATIPPAEVRADPTPMQGYFPLDQETVDGADAILHVSAA
ncbi:erythromycin esterase family protein [Amycolatopsis endophytica]|uniref:Erythromycin esterase-like protein n=1 Tax=Amycolatopsis endophytica TaxID=860233 RepID=A0A853AZX1_9PSEU|nr:erythromycin esterase family protein [Amycolatopsis endophytica]NYI88353.1 erythromycin esterase-like protein [Amycolatopsis endophytica]